MLPGNRVSTHPGEILRLEFLEPLGMSATELANRLDWNVEEIQDICECRARITPRLALLLGKAFGMSPEFWSDLQSDYDLTTEMQSADTLDALRHVEIVS